MQRSNFINFVLNKFNSELFKNSFWGIISNIIQNVFYSIFFIVIARKYSTQDFGVYIIANTLYGFVLAFSSLGLGQWFVRELLLVDNETTLISKFFKMQFLIGLIFYGVNVILSFTIYNNVIIRNLSLLIGVNVIFDNIIYVITYVNIAKLEQRRTSIIILIESVLKFLIACSIFYIHFSIISLALILILLRFVTLNLFLRIGSTGLLNIRDIIFSKVNFSEIKSIILTNWPFIVIGSISVLFWRIGNLFISKNLHLTEVAHFEISYKLFSLAQILPFIVSTSLFPILIKKIKNNLDLANTFFKKAFFLYTIYGLITYTFIYTFSDSLIPFLFGKKFLLTSHYSKEMFLTILVFPTALLQANYLVSIKKEKIDMQFNILSFLINVIICYFGFIYFKSISVVNYAIFISFIVFHIAQDIILYKQQITSKFHAVYFYLFNLVIVLTYQNLFLYYDKYLLFLAFWSFIGLFLLIYYSLSYSAKKSFSIAVF